MTGKTTTQVIVLGAKGKMGQEACKAIQQHPNFSLAAALGRDDDLAQVLSSTQCDVVVELTNASSVMHNTLTILEHNKAVVIGASGLSEDNISTLTNIAKEKQLGVIIAPNFSIGAILMMHFAQLAAPYMKHAEIIEAHHPAKIDAPSGTAIKTAALLAPHFTSPPGTSGNNNASRGLIHDTIPIHSLRMAGVIANQSIQLGSEGEQLCIQHTTLDRKAFMPGLLMACEQAPLKHELIYGMETLILG